MYKRNRIAAIIASFLWSTATLAFIDVEQHIWGFDGRVMNGCTIPLSVLVRNNTPTPFAGPVYLESGQFGNSVREVQPCFLAPGAQRWVQFHVRNDYLHNYKVAWRNGKRWQHFSLNNPPHLSRPTIVAIAEKSYGVQSRLPLFPEKLFPNHPAATRMLHGVVLDHMPKWSERKQTVLKEWLQRGGNLILAQERDGRFPVFTDQLSFLNDTSGAIGRGQVIRKEKTLPNIRRDEFPETLTSFSPAPKQQNFGRHIPESPLLQFLRLQMQPDHPWILINILSLIYLILIGPVAMVLFRKRISKVRWSMLFLLGVVTAFSAMFFFLGRRGYGESTSSRELILAQPGSNGNVSLTSWGQLFVTDSGNYPIAFGEGAHLLRVPSQGEGLSGSYQCGLSATADFTLPVFSTAGLVRESYIPAPDLAASKVTDEQDLYQVTGIPKGTPIWQYAVRSGNIYTLSDAGKGRYRIGKHVNSLNTWDENHEYYNLQHRYQHTENRVETAFALMSATALNLPATQNHRLKSTPHPDIGRSGTHLFLAFEAPESFMMQNTDLLNREGYVVYHFDLMSMETSND